MRKYLQKFNSYDNLTIVLIGTSTTSQEWCHPNWFDWMNYTFRQDDEWDKCWRRKIINTSRDGASIKHFIDNFESEILKFKPDLVIESLGINSILPKLDINETKNQLNELHQMILSSGIELATWSYALNSPKFSNDMVLIRDLQRELALEGHYDFVDIYQEFTKYDLNKIFTFRYPWKNELWGINVGDIDYIHCNTIGNQIIAESLLKELFNKQINDDEFGTMKLQDLTQYKL